MFAKKWQKFEEKIRSFDRWNQKFLKFQDSSPDSKCPATNTTTEYLTQDWFLYPLI